MALCDTEECFECASQVCHGGWSSGSTETASFFHCFMPLAVPCQLLPVIYRRRRVSMVTSIGQQSSPALEQVLSQLKGVRTSMRGWRACCPAHADRKPSLSIGLGEHGQVLLKCFTGCSLERIVEAMGLTMTDLFPDAPSASDGQAAPPGNTRHPKLSLLDLALEKQLHWKFLFDVGVMELPSGDLQIPYHLPDDTLAPRHRIRTALVANDGSLWSKGKG